MMALTLEAGYKSLQSSCLIHPPATICEIWSPHSKTKYHNLASPNRARSNPSESLVDIGTWSDIPADQKAAGSDVDNSAVNFKRLPACGEKRPYPLPSWNIREPKGRAWWVIYRGLERFPSG